uniref:Uncharacterized protein n=1 Tax=Sipha flava TaxID=143950 RepID=A0A2S2PWT8_9HEMI
MSRCPYKKLSIITFEYPSIFSIHNLYSGINIKMLRTICFYYLVNMKLSRFIVGLGQFSSLIRDKNDKKTFYHETPTVRNQNFYCQEFNVKELGNTVLMYFMNLTVLLIAF